jgi:hypothetical protein
MKNKLIYIRLYNDYNLYIGITLQNENSVVIWNKKRENK